MFFSDDLTNSTHHVPADAVLIQSEQPDRIVWHHELKGVARDDEILKSKVSRRPPIATFDFTLD